MAEQLYNAAATTIADAAGIDHDTLSVTLTDATGFPSTGNYRLGIDQEILICTAQAAGVCTVTRGAEGTTAAAHAQGATVSLILTAGGIIQYLTDNYVHL